MNIKRMDEYWRIINDKFYTVVKESRNRKAWNGPSESQYEGELAVLRPHFVNTVLWGAGSAIACFLSFRVSRKGSFTWSSRTGFIEFKKKKDVAQSLKSMKSDSRVNELQNGISIVTDVFISVLIGGSVSMFLSDFDKMYNDFEKIPLVSGRSLISDELCSDFLKQYNEVTSRQPDELQKMDKSFLNFISNCMKRHEVEQYLRESKSNFDHDDNTGIPIPYEGVDLCLRRIKKATQTGPTM